MGLSDAEKRAYQMFEGSGFYYSNAPLIDRVRSMPYLLVQTLFIQLLPGRKYLMCTSSLQDQRMNNLF